MLSEGLLDGAHQLAKEQTLREPSAGLQDGRLWVVGFVFDLSAVASKTAQREREVGSRHSRLEDGWRMGWIGFSQSQIIQPLPPKMESKTRVD